MFDIFIGIMALAALLSFLNAKFLKLPETIGVMILSIIASLLISSLNYIYQPYFIGVCEIIDRIEFRTILFDFLLGILLFAGAIHVNLRELFKQKSAVLVYSTLGVVLSTFIIGTCFYYLAVSLGLEIGYLFCLVFGALISPTDPVAVLAILKKAGAPKHLEIKVVGESLFNDGVGIVVLLSILSLATMMAEFEISHILWEFLFEGGGGIIMGILLGFLGKQLIHRVSFSPVIGVHISLAIVLGGYSLSSFFHVSGALAVVVAGLIIGQSLNTEKLSAELRNHVSVFWKVIDEIFNAVLFVLIGLEIITLQFVSGYMVLAVLSIIIVIGARYAVIFLSNFLLNTNSRATARDRIILTWAGLRGGISIALALTLPEGEVRNIIVFSTYVVVVFSIVVQGLTIQKLIIKPGI
jgi:CPA1 family monovalent cation:H+ antiporter